MGVLDIRGQRRAVFRPREFGESLKQSRLAGLSGDSDTETKHVILFQKLKKFELVHGFQEKKISKSELDRTF